MRFACLCLGLPLQPLRDFCEHLRVPLQCSELAELVVAEHEALVHNAALDAGAVVQLLRRCDAFRRPARFADALLVCACEARAAAGPVGESSAAVGPAQAPEPLQYLARALAAAQAVDTSAMAQQAGRIGVTGPQVGEMILQARVAAMAALNNGASSSHPGCRDVP